MILKRAGDHLRGGGGTAVDENGERGAVQDIAVVGHQPHLGFRIATLGVGDQALIEKLVGDIHRGAEDAARIVAKIDDQPKQFPGALFGEPLDGGAQIPRGPVLELRDADVAVAGFDHPGTHAVDTDFRTHQVEVHGCGRAIAPHSQVDVGAGFAA